MFTMEQYRNGLERIHTRIAPEQVAILQALCDAPDTRLSASELSRQMGNPYQSQIGHYSRFARELGNALGYVPQVRDNDTKQRWPVILKGNAGRDKSGSQILALHPELVQALYATGIVTAQRPYFPEEADLSSTSYPEGAVRQISVNIYERDPRARAECLAHHTARCCVCEFNFSETYGEIGTGYIHVHHLKQLSEVGARHEVNPKDDLRPVCPNCHAMLHKKTPPFSIEDLKDIIKTQSEKRAPKH